MFDKNKIMILCKVVDNYGDIGVVYRLARALSDLRPELELTLVVSNLESFQKMAEKIDPSKDIQDFRYKSSVWKIVKWDLSLKNETARSEAIQSLLDFQFSIILECFQCGRPVWLEEILFAPNFEDFVQIIQIDYLTAEEYADEFHLLKSGTRKSNIKKIFFMPGFTSNTGGLIINEQTEIKNERAGGDNFSQCETVPAIFKIFFFAYEDEPYAIVNAISDFQIKMRDVRKDFSVKLYLAEGKSSGPFEGSFKKAGCPFEIEKIPFLQQEDFDSFLLKMDFLFVRGEDSLSRAALSGLPYVWQAYKQDENYQLVKVNALIERMRPFFSEEDFEPVQKFWQNYNDYENPTRSENLTKMLIDAASKKNTASFKKFANSLYKNGNLAQNLLRFIDRLSLGDNSGRGLK